MLDLLGRGAPDLLVIRILPGIAKHGPQHCMTPDDFIEGAGQRRHIDGAGGPERHGYMVRGAFIFLQLEYVDALATGEAI